MKRKFFTFFVAFMALCFLGSNVSAQTPTTTDPILTGVTYYNIIYTTGGVDYYATFDPVSYDFSFTPQIPGSNAQALTFAFQTTDGTWGNCFYIYSLSNANNFLSENANWKSATYTGTTIPNTGTTDSWKKFFFVKDNVTGLYAIRPNNNNNGKCWFVPTLSTNNKIGVSAYFTAQGTQATIPAQGDALYCFKIQAATIVDQKPALSSLYDSSLNLYNSSVEGTAVGNYATGSRADFKGKIDAAKTVIDNASATADQIGVANGTLQTSLCWFRNKVVTNTHLLSDGYYYIYTKNPDGTKYYLTDKDPHTDATAAVQPVDYELAATGVALQYQQFKVTWDATASRYKIEGKYRLDNSYTHAQVNQDFSFDFNAYSTASNTFNILFDGSVAALKRVDSKGYIRPYVTSPGTATTVSTPTTVGAVTYSFSNAATINTFLGNSLIYNFEALLIAASQAELDVLQVQITAANALLASTTEGTALGQYTTANRIVLSDAITSATIVYNTANAYQSNVNMATGSLAAAITTYNGSLNTETNQLANGDYFIAIGGMYVNDPGSLSIANGSDPKTSNNGLQSQINIADGSQIFTIAKLSGVDRTTPISRYSFFNAATSRHLTEGAVYQSTFGAADDAWRSQNIYYNGANYAIQTAGSAASKGLWYLVTGNELTFNSIVRTPVEADYAFVLMPVSQVFSQQVAAGRATFNAAVTGTAVGQYTVLIYNAFQTALQTAEGIVIAGTATKTDLYAYSAALQLFAPNLVTGISKTTDNSISIYNANGLVKIDGANIQKVMVYDITGRIVKNILGSVSSVEVPKGQYIVKAVSQTTTKIEKVIVR